MATVFGDSPSEAAFFDEIINVYHPDYSNDSPHLKRKNVERAFRGNFSVGKILEETIEARSHILTPERPLINVNEKGKDFDDSSDLKTCSLNTRVNSKGYDIADGKIANLGAKTGPIRVILYNSVDDKIEFYFMTYEQWSSMATKDSISLSASWYTGVIKKIAQYRVDTFDELVRAK